MIHQRFFQLLSHPRDSDKQELAPAWLWVPVRVESYGLDFAFTADEEIVLRQSGIIQVSRQGIDYNILLMWWSLDFFQGFRHQNPPNNQITKWIQHPPLADFCAK
jgi:hypothetical protein